MSSFGCQTFKPSFGGKVIVPGCSDKSARANLQDTNQGGPKLTTYARSAAALEAYWAQRAAAGSAPVGPTFPGGEKALAYKTREACWKDSVHLDHQAGGQTQQWQGIPADIEDKETVRTRGITGFTGKQPQPGCSRPPPPAPDTSRWVAINAFDEPKPRVKGIVGYTGHQPPSPIKAAGQPAAAGALGAHQDTQYADQLANRPDTKTAWGPPAVPGISIQQQQQQQQQQQCYPAAPSTGSFPTYGLPGSAGSAGSAGWKGGEAGSSQYGRPHSTASSCYSPRFFMDGEEVPADRVQLPPHSASMAEQQQDAGLASCQHCCHQQAHNKQQASGMQAKAWSSAGTPQPQLAWGASSSTGPQQPGSRGTYAAATGSSDSSACCASQCIHQAAAVASTCRPCCSTAPGQTGQTAGAMDHSCFVAGQQQAAGQLPRTRATTYSAAFSPAAGFNFQQYMDSLKLAGSIRPGSAAAAYSRYQQQRQAGMQ